MGAKSYYLLSPRYSLDQTDTDKALAKLQTFINSYPDSEYQKEANAMAQELTTKKEKKAFEIGKQFVKLGKYYVLDYNISAIAALDNFISDHPGSVYREEAYFLRFSAATTLAVNSTFSKRKERLEEALAAYNDLLRMFPETQFSKEAEKLNEQLQGHEVLGKGTITISGIWSRSPSQCASSDAAPALALRSSVSRAEARLSISRGRSLRSRPRIVWAHQLVTRPHGPQRDAHAQVNR